MNTVELSAESPSKQRSRVTLRLGMGISATAYALGCALGAVAGLSTPVGALTLIPTSQPVFTLFTHNLGVVLLLCAGLVSMGIINVAVLGFNGILLGWVAAKELSSGHGDALMTGILPHFPFEFMAYVVSSGATIQLGVTLAGWVVKRGSVGPEKQWAPWLTAQAVAVGLLLVAAVVESNFSYV